MGFTVFYLYVKQHQITGLKYFGKTIKTDPISYKGSGKYWRNHIKKHGREHVITLNIWSFESQNECSMFALKFSKDNDIVKSKEWANLCFENGTDGGSRILSEETKQKMRIAQQKRWAPLKKVKPPKQKRKLTEDHKLKISQGNKNKTVSQSTRIKISNSKRGISFTDNHKNNLKLNHKGMKGYTHDKTTKAKMSQSAQNRPKILCPFCNKVGQISSMKRWHFDNCKSHTAIGADMVGKGS